jgi:hypothetical protein
VVEERSANPQTWVEEVVALVRHLVSDKNRIHSVSQQIQHQLLEHSVLPQLSARNLPLDNLQQEDSVSHLLWEQNQTLSDRQQRRQVHLDSRLHLVKQLRSDSLLAHPKQVRSLKRDKPAKRSHRLSDKLHNKEEEGSVRLQRSASHQLSINHKTLPLGKPLAWVSNLSQHLVSPQHLLNRTQHLVNPRSQVKIRHSASKQHLWQMEPLDLANQQRIHQRQH